MSNPVTEVDINNWRSHYHGMRQDQLVGSDFFIMSCLDTIENIMKQNKAIIPLLEKVNKLERKIIQLECTIQELESEAKS
jgi:hypothetical protein